MQNKKQKTEDERCEKNIKKYKKPSYEETYEMFQSLRQDGFFCDIKLKADDGKIIIAHKVVLAAASQYFYEMFTTFSESNHVVSDLVVMKEIDSTALELLVNFIYSGVIEVTEENVQDLLSAANILQLQGAKDACCDLLESKLCPTNCIGIYNTADLHSCTKLSTISELYIQQHFSEVIVDDFLSLSSKQVIKLISSDKLTVPSEEKVFECVIRWVNYELDSRKYILPQLMEHVRLPLTSKNYILNKVVEEPLIKSCFKCKDYISEALNYHNILNSELTLQNIRNKPRHGDKVVLVVGGYITKLSKGTGFYDPKINRWHNGPKMITFRRFPNLAVTNDSLVYVVGGSSLRYTILQSVEVLDLSSESPCFKPSVSMLIERYSFGVGVINNYLYVVGGHNRIDYTLDSAEVFDYDTQEWRMISSMSTRRCGPAVGVLNNLLYAVGGEGQSFQALDTVELYDPSLDTWTPVATMCVRRKFFDVGVLDGVLYAVGGFDGSNDLSSVEAYRPSTGVWTTIADMHRPRRTHGAVVALDGLLYVIGRNNVGPFEDSTEYYSPETNTWTIVTASNNFAPNSANVVAINRPRHFKTN